MVGIGAFAAALLAMSPLARAQDIFGRRGIYDATASPEIRGKALDYAYIRGEKPSFAELHGLASAPTVEVRRNFVYVEDTDGSLTIPYRQAQDLFDSFDFALRQVYRVLPDEFVFIYLFTAFETGVGAFFYQPEANNTRGIGDMVYDMNGASPRDGFVFMNYWQSFNVLFGQGGPTFVQGQSRAVFNQEAMHRWGAYVQAGTAGMGAGSDVLRGRDDAHWSYFLETNASPMEGNHWRDNGNNSFTTLTTFNDWRYSELDRYLMGLLPATMVEPFFVIDAPVVGTQQDITGQVINKASPPQVPELGGQITIQGHRVNLTIDDIITRNGVRQPAFGQAPTRWRSVFVMLAGKTSPLSETERLSFEQMVDGYAAGFKEATGNVGELDYAQNATPKMPIGGACTAMSDCDVLQANVCLTVPPVPQGSGLCTRPCSQVSSCPMDWCCQADSIGVKVCLPETMCQPEPPPDAGVSSAPDAGDDSMMMMGGADGGTGGAMMEPCACDTTTACDSTNGAMCMCDPECKAQGLQQQKSGCACVRPTRAAPALGLILFGAAILFATKRLRKKSRFE
jgi:hypothetical protein